MDNILIEFRERLEKNNLYTGNFDNNLKTLSIESISFLEYLRDYAIYGEPTLGYYDAIENKLMLRKKYLNKVIYHEIFHMSSTKDGRTGFRLGKKNLFGDCLTDVYTQILTKRYFGDKEIYECYESLEGIVLYIEELVGKDLMEDLFMKCDGKGLIRELFKYYSKQDVMSFIRDLDEYKENAYASELYLTDSFEDKIMQYKLYK